MNTAQVYGVVRAAGSEIALSIDSLEQVVSNPEILPVPETGTYVKGVVRRGDQLIPLVAVCDLLRRGAADSGSSELALMVRSSNRVLALAIDSIVKVARPDAASISALELRPGDNALFPCLFRDSETGEAVAVLDPAALAAHPHVRSVTRHAAAEAENTNSSERLKLACFRCAGKVFAIEISHVLRGVNAADHSITPIGTSFIPTFWEIEGRQLPMLNLPGFLCLPLASTSARAGAASSSRALLLQADGKQIGIEIDDVLGALNVPASDVEPIAHSGIANAQVYRGILRAADGDTTEQPILVLDAHAIIGHEDIRNVAVDVRSSEETAGDLGDRQSYIVYQSGHGTVASALRDIEAVIPLSNFLSLKPEVGFFWLHDFHCVLCLFNRLGSLLFAQSASSTASADGVLIRL